MKKSKRIELTENTIKYLAKKAIDEGTSFKPYVESILESLPNKDIMLFHDNCNFFERLKSFVDNVQVNDMAAEEEKDMIINVCEYLKKHNT